MYTFYLFFVSLLSVTSFFFSLTLGVQLLTSQAMNSRLFSWPDFIGQTFVAAAIWLFHWRYFNTKQTLGDASNASLMKLYAWFVVGGVLIVVCHYLAATMSSGLSLIFRPGADAGRPFAVGFVVSAIALPIWLYHFGILRKLVNTPAPIKKRPARALA